jgi:hypothetical protein
MGLQLPRPYVRLAPAGLPVLQQLEGRAEREALQVLGKVGQCWAMLGNALDLFQNGYYINRVDLSVVEIRDVFSAMPLHQALIPLTIKRQIVCTVPEAG